MAGVQECPGRSQQGHEAKGDFKTPGGPLCLLASAGREGQPVGGRGPKTTVGNLGGILEGPVMKYWRQSLKWSVPYISPRIPPGFRNPRPFPHWFSLVLQLINIRPTTGTILGGRGEVQTPHQKNKAKPSKTKLTDSESSLNKK